MDKRIKKELSIGTIITDGQFILGCRPFGRKDQEHCYDLPKGHWEEGETYLETAVREYKELVYGTEPVQTQSLANVLDEGTIGVTQFDDPVGFDVVGGDLPLNDFEHCEGCHSHVCQAIGTCQHTALAPYKAAWKR